MKISFKAIPDYWATDDNANDILMYKLIKTKQYWIFKFKTQIASGTEKEMETLAINLTKIYGTP